MRFIDCNCAVGKPADTKHFLCSTQVLPLMERLEYCHVDRAICWHYYSREGAPWAGNEMAVSLAKKNTKMIPAMVLLPNATKEIPDDEVVLEFAQKNAVGAIRIFPQSHMFSTRNYASANIYLVARELHLPVMLDFSQTSADSLYEMARENPEVHFIITSIYYRNLRYLYPVLEQCPNVYLETGFLKTLGSIESLCQRFGAHRLLYGSGAPEYDMGAAIGLILSAAISTEEKNLIASVNILRLMGEKV